MIQNVCQIKCHMEYLVRCKVLSDRRQFVRRGRVRFYVCLLLLPSPRPPLADWVSPGPAGPDPYARQSTNIFADYIFSDRISNRMPEQKKTSENNLPDSSSARRMRAT